MKDIRDIEIIERYKSGTVCSKLGRDFGVSMSRIGQILKKNGLNRNDGGKHWSKLERLKNKSARRDARSYKFYGCSHEEHLKFIEYVPVYTKQRINATLRGIGFNISLIDWCNIWINSGKFSQRGKGKNRYVMARKGDKGVYEVGNVLIISAVDNNHDGCIVGLLNSGKKAPEKYFP